MPVEWIFISRLSFGLDSFFVLFFFWCCCSGLSSLWRAHIGAAGVNGAIATRRQRTKSVLDNVFCSQTKEGADVLSFLEDSFVLVVIRLDASVCRAFLHAGCLSESIFVLSLDHYRLFIVLWSCYYLLVVDQNRFFFYTKCNKNRKWIGRSQKTNVLHCSRKNEVTLVEFSTHLAHI